LTRIRIWISYSLKFSSTDTMARTFCALNSRLPAHVRISLSERPMRCNHLTLNKILPTRVAQSLDLNSGQSLCVNIRSPRAAQYEQRRRLSDFQRTSCDCVASTANMQLRYSLRFLDHRALPDLSGGAIYATLYDFAMCRCPDQTARSSFADSPLLESVPPLPHLRACEPVRPPKAR
jgi:hypothetical protein